MLYFVHLMKEERKDSRMGFYAQDISRIASIGFAKPRGGLKQDVMHRHIRDIEVNHLREYGLGHLHHYYRETGEYCLKGKHHYSKKIDISVVEENSSGNLIMALDQVKAPLSSYGKNESNYLQGLLGENTLQKQIARENDITMMLSNIEFFPVNPPHISHDAISYFEENDPQKHAEILSAHILDSENPYRADAYLFIPYRFVFNASNSPLFTSDMSKGLRKGTIKIQPVSIDTSFLSKDLYTDIDVFSQARATWIAANYRM